ncbi:MAG: tetratricopeptide repeat protein [Spirochaetia bacterium]|nr:tetratricopeptide repeat protein [Spirochaetia bacterium]
MPGLSQLKKFNADILSLGNEPGLRASRGEKPVTVPIPKGIEDVDDSDDFITGMPEPVEYDVKPEKAVNVEEDFSDIMGTSSAPVASNTVQPESTLNVPDLSSLADLGAFADSGDEDSDMMGPDLSMFADPIEETEPETEPEPEEPEISDLSLEDLLGGMGFDGSEGTEENKEDSEEDSYNIPDDDSHGEEVNVDDIISQAQKTASVTEDLEDADEFDALLAQSKQNAENNQFSDEVAKDDFAADDFSFGDGNESIKDGNFGEIDGSELDDIGSDIDSLTSEGDDFSDVNDSDLAEVSEIVDSEAAEQISDLPEIENEEVVEENPDFTENDFNSDVKKSPEAVAADEEFAFDGQEIDMADGLPEEMTEVPESFVPVSAKKDNDGFDEISLDDIEESPSIKDEGDAEENHSEKFEFPPFEGFNLDDINLGDGKVDLSKNKDEASEPVDLSSEENPFGEGISIEDVEFPDNESKNVENSEIPSMDDDLSLDNFAGDSFSLDDLDLPEIADSSDDSAESGGDDFGIGDMTGMGGVDEAMPGDSFSADDLNVESGGDDFGMGGMTGMGGMDEAMPGDSFSADDLNMESGGDDFGMGDMTGIGGMDEAMPGDSFSADDLNMESGGDDFGLDSLNTDSVSSSSSETGLGDDFPNFDLNDLDSGSTSENIEDAGPIESFDISEMDGMEFPDTDSQLNGAGGFELGSSDEFGMENGDFEIPGFSDVDTVEVNKNGKIKIPEAEKKEQDEEDNNNLPPNTLSDEQYAKFIKNLSSYPLNVRIAVEELVVKNEFTDEAEFEIIKKVLKKVSARQLAAELEKMLDISIPVPRDFERRTAEEYEAYKQSFQYQLKNKIIPGAIVSVAAVIVCFFLFEFAKNFIYKPARASMLYKQGYALLESEDFPQSETKFNEATKYSLQRKWFFNYARGYRNHKQYIRAEQMYKNILYCFNHDKTGGLEYAAMELNDLANYEKVENILLRQVLDFHVNDQDGILLLGDNYLEWATEKDSSKFDDARRCYSDLIQLYGNNSSKMDLFSSRMMRYFIRTDNLLEVLTLKERFYPRKKSLSAEDWTDLSGYLLEKLYGPLAPADEYLRSKIEDVKDMLVTAVKADSSNPVAHYNIAKYYINTNNSFYAKSSLNNAINAFEKTESHRRKDIYRFIDSYRLLGEEYTQEADYLKAMESYTSGISLFTNENIGRGLEGNCDIGKLYSDYGDIEYFVAGNMDGALESYQDAIDNDYDKGEIRYKIGFIQYGKKNYSDAIGSFMKASEDFSDDPNLLLAMGNTLSLKNDNYVAQSYYQRLLNQLNAEKEQKGILFPQVRKDEAEVVDKFLKVTNNLGVTLYRLARRTGNSAMNAQAMVNFQNSLRAWDSMTRNQQSMTRLGGSNLAEQNIKYVIHPTPEYEPAIYTEIPGTLSCEEDFIK